MNVRSVFIALLFTTTSAFPVALGAAQAADGGVEAGPVAFDHARVIDGTGASVRPDTTVVVQNGIILSVGEPAPTDARHVDLTGRTLMPAIISDHSHIGLVKGTSASRDNYTRENILSTLKQYSDYGVLTVTMLGLNRSPLFDTLRHEQHEGRNPGADLFGVDQGIGAFEGVPPASMVKGVGPDQVFRPTTPEETRQDVDRMLAEHTDLVKLWVDDFRNDVPDGKAYPIMPPSIYLPAIDEAHRHGTRVAVHIHDLEIAKAMVAAKADILAHGVRDRPVDHDLIVAMQRQGTWYIATLDLDEANYLYAEHPELLSEPFVKAGLDPALAKQFADPKWRASILAKPLTKASHFALSINQKNLMTLYRAGVHIGFGTDSGAAPTRVPGFAEHRELFLTVQAGLTPLQAITLATGNAAALMNLSDRGVIAPGRRADLLIVDGNADQDIAAVDRIDQVWQRGVLISHGPLKLKR